MEIKHVSFDLWNTLFKGNPLFKQERISFLHKHYNPLGLSVEEVKTIIQGVDVMGNSVNEATGGNIKAIELYAMVLYQMGCPVNTEILDQVKGHSDALFLNYLPKPFDGVKEALTELYNRNITVSLLSNTGFIESKTVMAALKILGIARYVEFGLFSDVQLMSKPNPKLFDTLYYKLMIHYNRDIERHEILHVGDSVIADIEGGQKAGFKTFQVTTNGLTIKDVLNEILRTTPNSEPV